MNRLPSPALPCYNKHGLEQMKCGLSRMLTLQDSFPPSRERKYETCLSPAEKQTNTSCMHRQRQRDQSTRWKYQRQPHDLFILEINNATSRSFLRFPLLLWMSSILADRRCSYIAFPAKGGKKNSTKTRRSGRSTHLELLLLV